MHTKFLCRQFIALLILCFFASNSFAQSNEWDTVSFKTLTDYKLQQLNKSLIPSGILYDRMFPIADADEHKGEVIESVNPFLSDTTTPNQFIQAYYEIYNSMYNVNKFIKHPDTLESQLKYSPYYKSHPIGIMMYKINTIDTNALADHLLDTTATGQFIDVANPPRSPYFTHNTFFASPLLHEDEVLDSGLHVFYIDPKFLLQNQGITIQQVRIDFGDGSPEWVVNNPYGSGQSLDQGFNPLSILKNIGGTLIGRIIIVGIDILGNTIKYGNVFKIFVKSPETDFQLTACKGGRQKWVIEAPQNRLDPINAQYGNPQLKYETEIETTCQTPIGVLKCKQIVPVKDTAYFFFSPDASDCANRQVRKPIIFIDGFDPTNTRGARQIYANYINKRVDRNGNSNTRFGDYMLNENFDLIILDFKHGNDLLERNAMTLVSLIERLNAEYGSQYQQDITLIGPSMGSLIAQYALAYMEHNNIQHHVKTYISFDGCHQGANVPIGLQNYVEYFTKKGVLKRVNTIRNGLYNGLAARQMLAHHTKANSVAIAHDVFRTQFLQNLAAVGEYPTQCRNVAIINGANNGTINEFHPQYNHDLLRIYTQRKGWKSLWGGCRDKICMKLDWVCRTTPAAATAKVTDMWTVEPLFNILFWVPLGRKNTYAAPAWNNSAQDNAPGGTFGTLFGSNGGDIIESKFKFLLKESMYLLTGSKRTSFTQNINEFTMMPSYSAADLRFETKDLNLNWRDEYLCGKTPFNYVYAPIKNERHVSISPESSWWFEDEVKKPISQLPIFTKMTGSSHFCSETSEYTAQFCNENTSGLVWNVTPSGIVSLSSSGTNATLTKITNGNVVLTATLPNGRSITKNITVSSFTMAGNMYNSVNTTPVQFNGNGPYSFVVTQRGSWVSFTANVTNSTNLTNLKWYRDDIQLTGTGNTFSTGVQASIYGYGTVFTSFRLEADAPCGKQRFDFGIQIQSLGWFYEPTVSPNPATDNINVNVKKVEYENAKEPTAELLEYVKKANTTFRLIDNNTGAIVKNWQLKGIETSQYSFNIANVKNGLYTLQMERLGQKYNNQVLIVR